MEDAQPNDRADPRIGAEPSADEGRHDADPDGDRPDEADAVGDRPDEADPDGDGDRHEGGAGRRPEPDATVECVAAGGSRASLIAVGPAGPTTWLEFAVRPVPAYRRASVAVWVLAVLAVAFALHPLVAPWPPAGRAGLVLAMAVAGRLMVAAVADAVWTRLVESLVLDGAQAVLEARTEGRTEGGSSGGRDRYGGGRLGL